MTLLFRREVASMLSNPPPRATVPRHLRHQAGADLDSIELLAAIERISSNGLQQSVQLHRVGGDGGETWVTRTEGGREWFPRVGRVEKKRIRAVSDGEEEVSEVEEYQDDPRQAIPERSKDKDRSKAKDKARNKAQGKDRVRKKHKHRNDEQDKTSSRSKRSSRRHSDDDGDDQHMSTPTTDPATSADTTAIPIPNAPKRKTRRETMSRRELDRDDLDQDDSGDETERERDNGSVRGKGKGKERALGSPRMLTEEPVPGPSSSVTARKSNTAVVATAEGTADLGRGKRRCAGRSEEPPLVKAEEFADDLASLCGRVNELDVWSNVGDGEPVAMRN